MGGVVVVVVVVVGSSSSRSSSCPSYPPADSPPDGARSVLQLVEPLETRYQSLTVPHDPYLLEKDRALIVLRSTGNEHDHHSLRHWPRKARNNNKSGFGYWAGVLGSPVYF